MGSRWLAGRTSGLDGADRWAPQPPLEPLTRLPRLRWGALAALSLLLASLPAPAGAAEDVGCVYYPRATAAVREPELTTFAHCGSERDDGTAEIRPEHLLTLNFDADRLAVIRVGEHFYYFRPDGRSARVPTWDNWADDFAEGLVRTVRTVDGVEKVGYLDRQLAVVIAPRFDWGFPFEGGRALVCIGCRTAAPDDDGHAMVTGGLWGYIDKAGTEVVPVRLTREELLKQTARP